MAPQSFLLALVAAMSIYIRLSIAASMQQTDLCSLLGNNPLPFGMKEFCSATGLDSPGSSGNMGCTLLGMMEDQLQGLSSIAPDCNAARQTPAANVALDGTPLPFPLSDQRPLPADLQSVVSNEGASMYWHYKHLHNFGYWCSCATTNTTQTVTKGLLQMPSPSQQWLKPAGWQVVSTLWLKGGGEVEKGTAEYSPFAVIIKQDTVSMMSVLLRGSHSLAEWMADFDYAQVSDSSNTSLNLPGSTHAGFTRIANYLWANGIKAALDNGVVRGGSISTVTFAGHSLGAGVATLLSYAAQSYLNKRLARRAAPVRVDALLYAPPNAGDATFVAAFNNLVNARRIVFSHDVVPQVPCSPVMAACSGIAIPTLNPDGSGVWQYSSVAGSILIQPSAMPQQASAWGGFGQLYGCKLPHYLIATHTCSYSCFLSSFVKDRFNMCLLHDKATAGGQGSYCTSQIAAYPDPDKYPYAA